jgi:hypothetical protein
MEQFIAPMHYANGAAAHAILYAAYELRLDDFLEGWGFKFFSPTAQPDVKVVNSPSAFRQLLRKPYFKLPPVDLSTLVGDAAKRQRWAALFTHTVMPPLRLMAEVLATKVCACTLHDILYRNDYHGQLIT